MQSKFLSDQKSGNFGVKKVLWEEEEYEDTSSRYIFGKFQSHKI